MLLCRKTFQTTENYKSDQIGRQNEQNDELRRKTFKTTQNYESDQIIMNCIDITSKWSKMLLCHKTFQTTENYKSDQIGRQNEQNDELRRKTFKTT